MAAGSKYSGKSYSSGKSYGSGKGNYSGGYSGGAGHSSYSPSKPPQKIYTLKKSGIELWGSSRTMLQREIFEDTDIVINCDSTSVKGGTAPLKIKSAPDWAENLVDKYATVAVDEFHLNVPDFKTPPFGPNFWRDLYEGIASAGYTRIFVCCAGGQGRTGTVLGTLISVVDGLHPEEAISTIRKKIPKALETLNQEDYLYEMNGLDPPDDEPLPVAPKKKPSETNYQVVKGKWKHDGFSDGDFVKEKGHPYESDYLDPVQGEVNRVLGSKT